MLSFLSLNLERVTAIKYLFGVMKDGSGIDGVLGESVKSIPDLAKFFGPEASVLCFLFL